MTPEFLAQLRSHVSAEAYRQLPPDDLWARVRDALDETAFRVLLERVGGRVYRRCRAGLGDPQLADEAFQDTFCDLVRKRALIPTYAAAAAWAYQAALNHTRRLRRKQWRQVSGGAVEGAASRGDPVVTVDAADAADRALADLPDKYRRPIELVYYDGLTHAEAAAALGWSKGTVDSYVARGLKRLRMGAARFGLPAAGAIAVEGVLARPAAALSDEVLTKFVRAVWTAAGAPAAAAGWPAVGWKKAAVALVALGATAAAGVWWGGPAPRPAPPPASPPAVAAAPAESLQDRNLRITRDELVGPLRDNLQKFYPADNPVVLADLRAHGSEVEVEFRTTRPPPTPLLAERLRARYCTYRRRLVIHGQPHGETKWYWMNPEQPLVIPVPNPFGKPLEIVRGREEFTAAERLFDRLPPDTRAGPELLRHLFGHPGGGLLLPSETKGVSGFDDGLILATGASGLFVREDGGRWRYAGECPGWFPVVASGRVFCYLGPKVLTRPLADPTAGWERWCDLPNTGPGESVGILFVAADRLYVTVHPNVLYSRPLDPPAGQWRRTADPLRSNGQAEVGGTLFGNDGKNLLARPAAVLNAAWLAVGPWPDNCNVLVSDGDRLLAFDGPGPIYGRPAEAGPNVPWAVVGRVHDPYQR